MQRKILGYFPLSLDQRVEALKDYEDIKNIEVKSA